MQNEGIENIVTGAQNKNSIDRQKIEEISSKYRFDFDHISIYEQVTDYVKKEVPVRKGAKKTKPTWDKITKTEFSEEKTKQAKKDFIMALNPYNREDILAAVHFLSSFMPTIGNKSGLFFDEALAKYNSVVTKAQQVYENDATFIKELNALKTPFINMKKDLESSIKDAQNKMAVLKRKQVWGWIKLCLSIVVFVAMLGSAWLLYDEIDLLIIPIIIDVFLILSYIGMKFMLPVFLNRHFKWNYSKELNDLEEEYRLTIRRIELLSV